MRFAKGAGRWAPNYFLKAKDALPTSVLLKRGPMVQEKVKAAEER